jgi:hypothetical protein
MEFRALETLSVERPSEGTNTNKRRNDVEAGK